MAWGEWMVPNLGPEHWLTLEKHRRAVQAYSTAQVREMLAQLCELSLRQELIIRQATQRIAELECREALRDF